MLVLSRRPDQKFAFPDLGVSVTLLSVRGNVVKVGIQAPPEIRVIREELGEQLPSNPVGSLTGIRLLTRERFHELKNQLNTINLCLRLYQRQREAGLDADAENTLSTLQEQFQSFHTNFAGSAARNRPAERRARCQTLLVEDDSNERELLAGILRLNGYEVITARDGQEAIEYLESHPAPDLVLLDMVMPRCDGRKTIESIRRNPKLSTLKVFAVSGTEPSMCGVATGPGGVDRWFEKPLDPETLIREIRHNAETLMPV